MNLKESFAAFDLAESAVSVIVHPPALGADKQAVVFAFSYAINRVVPKRTIASVEPIYVILIYVSVFCEVVNTKQTLTFGSENKSIGIMLKIHTSCRHAYL